MIDLYFNVIMLIYSLASVKVHHYSKDRHALVVNCHPVHSSSTDTEVTLKFDDDNKALEWQEVIVN